MKRLTFLLFFMVALFAACTRTEPVPTARTYTETDLAAVMAGLGDDWASFDDPDLLTAVLAAPQAPFNQSGCPGLENLFTFIAFKGTLSSEALTTLAGTSLARGTYTYDATSGACTSVADTDILVLRYPYSKQDGTGQAELSVDWGDTLNVAGPSGDLFEVPTAVTAELSADGRQIAAVSADLSWYNAPDCGSADGILEPTRVSLSGNVGSVTFSNLGYSLSDSELLIGGALTAGPSLSADLSLRVSGTLTRSACFVDSFAADTGSLSFGAASTMTDDSHSFRVNTNFSDVVFADFDTMFEDVMAGTLQGVASLRLSDGTVKVDDDVAATFEGVLDDANANGTPGENVTLQFSGGGTSTLEAYLISYGFDALPTATFTKALTLR